MSTWAWLLILGFGLVKLPIALLMLWLPFRSDESAFSKTPAEEDNSSGEDEGGSKTLPGSPRTPDPRRPHPRPRPHGPRPRRGPHGDAPPPSPARSRRARRPLTRRVSRTDA